jgi:hypothetical protein
MPIKRMFYATVFFLLLLSSEPVQAQKFTPNFSKGDFLLKGSGSIRYLIQDGAPLWVQLGGGYFIFNHFLAGADIGYERAGKYDDFYLRPFLKLYLFNRVTLGGGVNGKINTTTGKETQYFDAEGGLIFLLDSAIAIEPTFRYPFDKDIKPEIGVNIILYLSRW